MIFLFLISLTIGGSCYLWRHLGLRVMGIYCASKRHEEGVTDDFTDVIFSFVWQGVAVLGAILTASALFGPVSGEVAIICLVLPYAVFLIRSFRKELWHFVSGTRREFNFGPTALIVPAAMLALVSFLGSQPII